MNERNKLLQMIQAQDFAIYEAALYLDAHPNCKRALDFYHKCLDSSKAMKKEFEEKYGPLTIYGNNDKSTWRWVETPWPWEREVN